MKSSNGTLQFHALCFISVLPLTFVSSAKAVDLTLGSLKVNKILFLGNSITYHPYNADVHWYHNWGMAASEESKDYVHVLTSKIAAAVGGTPTIKAINIANTFEKNFSTCDPANDLSSEIAFAPDLIVLAVGENVTLNNTTDQANYATAYANLLSVLKAKTGATIYTRSCFWADTTKDGIMKAATVAAGDHYVDISSLCVNKANFAYSEEYYASNSTINTHPGDAGMANIASALYSSMVANSVPEPNSCVLVCMAAICLGGIAWRRRRKFV
jgi:hypothetical protein